MAAIRKEHSVVRFAKGTKTLPKLLHMYKPELHRQVTERVPVSRLGHELTLLCQAGLGEAFDVVAVAEAKLELTELLDKVNMCCDTWGGGDGEARSPSSQKLVECDFR